MSIYDKIIEKDRHIAGMEAELADYGETVTKLRACLARQGADLVKYSGTINQLQAELQGCRERLEAWHDYYERGEQTGIMLKLQDLGEV